ncbi:MAG: FAD-binding oxidoreductase [Rhodoferax sp.]|nr:MAG: FAD-binding oxidoreductase [Rhodoferax sp.]
MFDSAPQYLRSYYSESLGSSPALHPTLQENLEVDVAIVGAGFTGLYTAIRLAQAGQKVAIVEASRVGWGASGRNGGQLVLGFSCDMPPFEAALGLVGARAVWQLVREAAQEIRNLIHEHQIDCDLRNGHLWTSVLQRRVKLLHEWQQKAAHKWGYEDLQFVGKADLPQYIDSARYQAGLIDPHGGQLHPLKYVLGLAQLATRLGVRIFEQTRAKQIEEQPFKVLVHTPQGCLRAQNLVLACNAYIDKLYPPLQAKVLPVGTYIIATEPLGPERARSLLPTGLAVTDNQFILDYFRLSADHRLLFGGKCTYTGHTPRNLAQSMRADMLRVFPQLQDVRIDYAWGGHIDITMNRAPDFGHEGAIYWAQGFSGHGIVPSCVAGRVLANAILGNDSELKLFEGIPHHRFPGGEKLAGLMQVAGMSYYRLRDYF